MKNILFILIFQSNLCAFAQITFEKAYLENNIGYAVAAYEDSNSYILGGMLNEQTQYKPLLIKINLYGDTIWTNILHSINGNNLYDMAKTNDGGYVFMNSHSNLSTKSDIYLIKVNGLGNILWNKSIVKQNWDYGNRLIQTSNNSYIIAGNTNSLPGITSPYPYNAYIVKTNSNGDSTYTRNYGRVNENDYVNDVIETSDSNYVFVGYGVEYGLNNYQLYLIKLKPNGDTLWTKNIGNALYEYGYSIKETLDKNYIITGQRNSGPPDNFSDIYIIKTNTSGNVLWEKTYNFNFSDFGYGIIVLSNGYLIAGTTSNYTSNELLLIRINNFGDTLWTKIIQISNPLYPLKSIVTCTDKGYLITGWASGKLVLFKTDSMGCIKPFAISINGEQNVSLNDTITYHNNSIRSSGCFWFSSSGNIVSGQGINTVNIVWNQVGIDTLYSVAYNECGSDTLSFIINIDSCVIPVISSINGDFNLIALGSMRDYYVDKIQGKSPVSYIWTTNLGNIISGQGTDSITVEWNNYGIENMIVVAENECGSDTSYSIIDIFDGIKETSDSNNLEISVFPVPTNNILYLNLPFNCSLFKIEIFDIYGKQIYFNKMLPGRNEINLSS